MKIIFMGSQDFSVPFLNAAIQAKHNILEVFTSPPGGTGRNFSKNPVHIFSENLNLKINTSKTLKNITFNEQVDFIIVVAYGNILPKHIIEFPRYCCINIHPSMLPRWRGAAPIERTLISGDTRTAATIMKMDCGLDTGEILSEEIIEIENTDNYRTLSAKLINSGITQLIDVINNIEQKLFKKKIQSEIGVTYAHKITSTDKVMNFTENTYTVQEATNRVRAIKSGVLFELKNLKLKIFEAQYEYCNVSKETVGTFFIQNRLLYIICNDGYLIPKKLQRANSGGKILNIIEFINGLKI